MGGGASAAIGETLTAASDDELKAALAGTSPDNKEKLTKALQAATGGGGAYPPPNIEPTEGEWPSFNFGDKPHPPPPDYGNLDNWCAHPNKDECAANNLAPDGVAPMPLGDRPCDCFFVVGTNFIRCTDAWNAPVPDPVTDEWNDYDVMQTVTAMNNRCKLYAPRYRQNQPPCHGRLMHPANPENLRKAAYESMELAYTDLERAFAQFLECTGKDRPIIIASHSQGTMHATRLMEKFHQDSELRNRLVCAYLLGPCGTFVADKFEVLFPTLHGSTGPLDLECIVAFDAMSAGHPTVKSIEDGSKPADPFPIRNKATNPPHNVAYPGKGENGATKWTNAVGRPIFCTNPLTWSSDLGRADASLYLGRAVATTKRADGTDGDFGDCLNRKHTGIKVTKVEKADVGTLWAEIAYDGGVVLHHDQWADPVEHEEWQYWFFNVRENCDKRVDEWLKCQLEKSG